MGRRMVGRGLSRSVLPNKKSPLMDFVLTQAKEGGMDPSKIVVKSRLEANSGWFRRKTQGGLDVRRLFCSCCLAPFLSKLGGGACRSGCNLGQGSDGLEGHADQRKKGKGFHGGEMRDSTMALSLQVEDDESRPWPRSVLYLCDLCGSPSHCIPCPTQIRVRLPPFLRSEQSFCHKSEAYAAQNQHHRVFGRRPTSLPCVIGTSVEP